MIIPIGHDDSWTKRQPLATWSIALICVAAWIGTLVSVSDMQRIPQERFQEQAREFWEAHPYLEIEGHLARYMILREDPEALSDEAAFTQDQWDLWVANKRLRAAAAHRASMAAGETPEDLSDLQGELDQLVGLGFYADPDQLPLDGEYPAAIWGLTPAKSTWYTYVTHVFMHGSWSHLLGNLFLFLIAAPALEDRWGRALFAGFFVATGVAAGGFHALMELGSEIPLVGASGAISAVLGAFLVLNFSTRIKFAWILFPPFYGTFRSPAWICLPYWFLNEVSSAFMSQADMIQDNVAYWAHVGGFLSGSLLAVTVKGMRLEERFLHEAIRRKMAKAGRSDQLARARSLIEDDLLTDAQIVLEEAIEDHPHDPETLCLFVEFARKSGRIEDAEPRIEEWLKVALGEKPDRLVLDTWCRLTEIEPALAIAPATLVRLGSALAPRGLREEAAHALRLALSDIHETSAPGSMLRRIAELAPRLPDAADLERRALELLCDDPQLPEERQAALRARLEGLDAPAYADPFAERLARLETPGAGTPASPGLTTPIEIDFDDDPAPTPAIATSPQVPGMLAFDAEPGASDSHPIAAPRSGRELEASDPFGATGLDPDAPRAFDTSGLELDAPGSIGASGVAAMSGEAALDHALDEAIGGTPGSEDAGIVPDTLVGGVGEVGSVGDEPEEHEDVGDWLDDADVPMARFSDVKAVDAVPIALDDTAIRLRVGPERTSRLALERVDGVALGIVDGLGERPVAVIDLLLNGRDSEADVLQLVRLRSDRFDPRTLAPGNDAPMVAFGAIAMQVCSASGAPSRRHQPGVDSSYLWPA